MRLNKTISLSVFLFFILSGIWVQGQSQLSDDTTMTLPNELPDAASIELEEEIVPVLNKDTVRNRLNRIQSSIPLAFNKTIFSFIHYFTVRNREYSKMVLSRKEMYFPLFEAYLKEHQMPDELKYLAIVESGLNPKARSKAGAVGLWQFVKGTGKDYKMHIDWYIDERHDAKKSTEAACKYLKLLHHMFDDWELALAAYNCGQGNVRKAIRRSRHKKDFWEIYNYLPRETRSYVPQFIAIMYMMNFYKEHYLTPEYNEVLMMHDTLWVNQYVNLEVLSKELNICVEDIHKLNPILTRNVAPGHIRYFPLKLPADKMHFIRANLCSILDSCSKPLGNQELVVLKNPNNHESFQKVALFHTVRKGEGLHRIALKYNVKMNDLRAWNSLETDHVKIGQKLAIMKNSKQELVVKSKDTEEISEDKIVVKQKESKSTKYKKYQVQPGDTLWSIARKYDNLSVDKLKKLNKLKGNEVKVGQVLLVI